MNARKAKPTPADLRAAAKLRAIWETAGLKPSQGEMALAWSENTGKEPSQSLMSQYINGKIRLNYRAVVFFAGQLDVAPTDIRDDLPEQHMSSSSSASLAEEIDRLLPEDRHTIETLVHSLQRGHQDHLYDTGRYRLVKQKDEGRDKQRKRGRK